MIRPYRSRSMPRQTALVQWTVPLRLMPRTRSQSSALRRTRRLSEVTPALLTTISIFLCRSTIFFDAGIDLSLVGNIEGCELPGAPGLSQLLERLLGCRRIGRIVDDDMRAEPGQVQGNGAADTTARAGNQCNLTF